MRVRLPPVPPFWKVGRVDDCAGFEIQRGLRAPVSSNLTPSAILWRVMRDGDRGRLEPDSAW